jgi:hypothetical protein
MKTTIRLSAILLASACTLAACAKSTREIPAQYISPMQYGSYSCKQLELEMQTVASRVSEVGGQVDRTAENDSAKMGIGLILFWPTLFFLDGDTPQAAEYARLKGEFDALEKAAIQKGCNIKVERPKLPEREKKDDEPAYPSQSGRR